MFVTMTSGHVRICDMTFDLVVSHRVTRVKKVNLAKLLLLLQFTWYCHVTHGYGSPKLSLYRLYTKKISKVIWGHKVKYKGQILNNVKWQNKRCQHVGLGQTCKKSSRWRFRPTYGSGVKGQKRSNFKQRQMAKLTMPTCWPWSNMQKSPRWPLCPTYSSGVKGQKRSNIK